MVEDAMILAAARAARLGQVNPQQQPVQLPLMPLEEAIARLVEVGILTPEQGWGTLFAEPRERPTEYRGKKDPAHNGLCKSPLS